MATQNNTFLDSSSNNLTITKNGNVGQGSLSPFLPNWSVRSAANYGFNIDASSNAPSKLVLAGTQKTITVEAWIFSVANDANGRRQIIISNEHAISTNSRWSLYLTSDGGVGSKSKLAFGFSTGAASNLAVARANADLSLNTWNHVAMTIDATTPSSAIVKLYVNGVGEQFTVDLSTHTATSGATSFVISGATSWNVTDPLKGYLSNLRVVRSIVYSNNFAVPTAPLTSDADTVLLTCQDCYCRDNSPNKYSLVTSAIFPTTSPFSPFTTTYSATSYAGSAYFDGASGNYLNSASLVSLGISTSAFTFELWFMPMNTLGGRLCNFGSSTSTYGIIHIVLSGTQAILYSSSDAGTSGWNQVNGAVLGTYQPGRWYHIAFSRAASSSTLNAFFNGKLVYSANTLATSQLSTCRLVLGWDGSSPDSVRFNGYISNARLVKSQLYSADFAVPTTPLTAVANTALLLRCDNIGVFDSTCIGDIVTVGAAKAQGTVVKSGAGSLSFDGNGDYFSLAPSAIYNQLSGTVFTLEFWVYPDTWAVGTAYNEARTIIGTMSTNGSVGWRIDIDVASVGTINWVSGTPSTVIKVPVTLNSWTHMAYVYSGSTLNIYKNGFLVSTTAGVSWTNNSDPLTIGAALAGSYLYYFDGYLDNIQLSLGAKYVKEFNPDIPNSEPDKTTYLASRPTCQFLLTGDGDTTLTNNSAPMDASPAYDTVTASGTSMANSFSPFSDNWSVYFPPGASYISSAQSVDFDVSGGDFTIEFWFNALADSTSHNIFLVGVTPSVSPVDSWVISVTNLNNIYVSGLSTTILSQKYTIEPGKWYHLALVHYGTNTYLFVNGAMYATTATFSSTNTTLYIGCHPSYTTRNFTGYISNVRIVKGTAVYTSPFTPPTEPLTAISGTTFLGCNGPTISDATGRHTLTTSGSPTVKTLSPFLSTYDSTLNGSLYFNGNGDYYATSDLGLFSTSWTIEAWVYCAGLNTGTMNIVQSQQGTGSWVPYVSLGVTSTGYISVCLSGTELVTTSKISLYAWTHIALCKVSGATRLFVDGAVKSLTINYSSSINLSFFIGRTSNVPGGGSYICDWKGYISNLRIVVGTSLYSSTFKVAESPLTSTANTSLLTAQSSGAIDASSNPKTLTKYGNPSLVDFSPFGQRVTGTSVFCNTYSNCYMTVPSRSDCTIGESDFTIEGWFFRIVGIPNVNGLFGTTTTGGLDVYTSSTSSSATYIVVSVLGGTSTTFTAQTMRSLQWHHIAVTRRNGTLAVFLDGKSAGTASWTQNLVQQDFVFGKEDTNYWQGYISSIRLVIGTALYDPSAEYIAIPRTHLLKTAETKLLLLQTQGLKDEVSGTNAVLTNATLSTMIPYQSGSIWYDGTSGSTYINTDPHLETLDFTVEGWFYLTSLPATATLFAVSKPASIYGAFRVVVIAGVVYLNMSYNGTSWAYSPNTGYSITPNTWNHVILCRRDGTVRLYVNGIQLLASSLANSLYSTSQTFYIGRDGSGNYMPGYVSNVRFIKGIGMHGNNSNIRVPTSPPIPTPNLQWLLPFNSTSVTDSTGNFVVSTSTVKPVTTSIVKSGSTCLYFDGASYLSVVGGNLCFDGDFTIEFWMYRLTPVASWPQVFCLDNLMGNEALSSYNYKMLLGFDVGNSTHSFVVANSSLNAWAVNIGLVTPSLNAWHHYAITRNGSAWKVFVDGVQAGAATYSGTVPTPTLKGFSIGAGSSTSYNKAYIDNFKITIGESLYNSAFTPTY